MSRNVSASAPATSSALISGASARAAARTACTRPRAHRRTEGANAAGSSSSSAPSSAPSGSAPPFSFFSRAVSRAGAPAEGLSLESSARMGYSAGCTAPSVLDSSASAASASFARRNGCVSGKRRKNSSPATARRDAPPAAGVAAFMYPTTFVSRAANANVAPLRT